MAKHPNAREFVLNVMELVGAENPTELSKKLGGTWVERDQQRKLYKWHRGEQAPNFAGTLALLRLAGMLREDGAVAFVAASSDPVSDRLRGLEAMVERQGKATTRTLKGLEAQLAHIRDLLEPPAQAATEDRG